MMLERGLMLLVTVTSGWDFTMEADGEGSWIWQGSTCTLVKGLTWLLLLFSDENAEIC